MGNRLSPIRPSNLYHPFRYQGTRNTCPEKILVLVKRRSLKHWKNEIAGKLFSQVVDVAFGGTSLQRFLLQPLQFLLLPDVGAERDYFRRVLLLDPLEDNRSIEPARVSNHDFHCARILTW